MRIFVCVSYILFVLFVIPTFINNYIRYTTTIRAPVALITRNPSYFHAALFMSLVTPFLLFVDELHYVFYASIQAIVNDRNVSDLTGFIICLVIYSLLFFFTLLMASREYETCYLEAHGFIVHIKNHYMTNTPTYEGRESPSLKWVELEMMQGQKLFYIRCPMCPVLRH